MPDRRDTYYHRARESGFRSRASYKILEMQEKFGILKEGDLVLEIGASPGGWTQVIQEITGEPVVAVDIVKMDPIPGVIFVRGNLYDPTLENTLEEILSDLKREGFDAILSDAMVKTSGDVNIDHSSSYLVCKRVMELAERLLDKGGNVVVKQFQGDLTGQFFSEWGKKYRFKKKTTPRASRSGSREIYVIFEGKKTGKKASPQ